MFCRESLTCRSLRRSKGGAIPARNFRAQLGSDCRSRTGRSDHFTRWQVPREAIERSRAIFICVGTPRLQNGDADLSAIEAVAQTIAKGARGYRLIVEKSTVPVQTGCQLRRHLALHNSNGLKYDVVSNPEFLREGSAVEDFTTPTE